MRLFTDVVGGVHDGRHNGVRLGTERESIEMLGLGFGQDFSRDLYQDFTGRYKNSSIIVVRYCENANLPRDVDDH